MELFIRLIDGKPFEHPIVESNFRMAFPDVDTDNLPPQFARFKRIDLPKLKPYEVYEGVSYEKLGDFYCDVHHVRDMTNDEKQAKIERVKKQWADGGCFFAWVFNEEICDFEAPIPYPTDGNLYFWDDDTNTWKSP